MNKITTIQQLKEAADQFAADCADAFTTTKHVQFNAHGCMIYPTKESRFTASMRGDMTDHALSQIAGRIDAPPMTWLSNPDRCPVELRAKIMNNLTAIRPDTGLFIRHKGDKVRAVMSSQYTPFDNAKFVDLIEAAVANMGVDVQVHRAEVGDTLSAYILVPGITFDHDPAYRDPRNGGGNGGLHPAVYVSNSEIGTGSARTSGGLYRSVCSNGAIYGWKSDEGLAVRHRYLTPYGMRSIIASGLAEAFKMSEACAKAYVQAQEIEVPETALKSLVTEWSNKYGLTIAAKDNWLAAVAGEWKSQGHEQPMAIDVFNAATFSAHSIENHAERELVERMAGDYLQAVTGRQNRRR